MNKHARYNTHVIYTDHGVINVQERVDPRRVKIDWTPVIAAIVICLIWAAILWPYM